jgi:hypothetical protein
MSVVRPEFGPTLPELLGPRLRALPRAVRLALAAALAALVVLALVLIATRDDGLHGAQVHGQVAFNVQWTSALHRVAPHPGELLRLQDRAGAQSYVVRPLRLAPYQGDTSAVLTGLATQIAIQMRASVPGFVLRQEGRARIANQPGYQIQYQFTEGGHTAYGRRVLLTPDQPGVRGGADIDLRAPRSPQVPNFDAAGSAGALKQPLRSFHFGS